MLFPSYYTQMAHSLSINDNTSVLSLSCTKKSMGEISTDSFT